jgi:methyl-accepting chemotaxis protein
MKGTIVKCMEDLVGAKFGAAKWKECLKRAGFVESKLYSTLEDVSDADVMALMKAVGEAAGLSGPQVMSAFGEHWSTVYAPKLYKPFFDSAKSTRDFLLKLDDVHVTMTKSIKSARPPRFKYEWQGDKHLVMHYESARGLVALMPGLIAGLGKYYKDHPSVRLTGNAVHVQFA